tara:strand:+ start:2329 stop:2706 length:378 start_codon:yes stop_codon:yes gene_type:complete
MSRNNSRTNSIDISKSRSNSWEYRRSNSFGSSSSSISSSISIETNEYELDNSPTTTNTTNADLLKIKPKSMKIIINNVDKKKRNRDVYIDINDPYKDSTPTPMSYLASFIQTDLLWVKTKGKYEK